MPTPARDRHHDLTANAGAVHETPSITGPSSSSSATNLRSDDEVDPQAPELRSRNKSSSTAASSITRTTDDATPGDTPITDNLFGIRFELMEKENDKDGAAKGPVTETPAPPAQPLRGLENRDTKHSRAKVMFNYALSLVVLCFVGYAIYDKEVRSTMGEFIFKKWYDPNC